MWLDSLWSYLQLESNKLLEWAKCGETAVSMMPTLIWAAGAAAMSHRLLSKLFRRFMFRRVALWEVMLQNLLFIWMVIYSIHFWVVLVNILKMVVDIFYYDYTRGPDIRMAGVPYFQNIVVLAWVHRFSEEDDVSLQPEENEGRKLMQQWLVWMCSMTPLALYIHTRPRFQSPPLMIWITTSPWQRREMGAYGYYLNRPLSSLPSTAGMPDPRIVPLRRAFSDSKIIIKELPKKKRYSKSV